MCGNPDGADSWPTSTVRDAEGLVQVQMADVRADVAGAGQPHLRVHVRAVHVNLPAMGVDDFTNLLARLLEDAVGGRIGDHQAGEVLFVGFGFGAEIGQVDVAG